ncbi:MAG: Cof-type HAD-IIB family hydrolase [Chloroflexota bacterium]|nr:Cof-type HAD-IIB family hydrolase [Chloroflexota bacterium]
MTSQIKLIVLDIDGTLFNSKGLIPEANRRAVKQAKERGVRVVLATVRAFPSAVSSARQLELDTPIICANGALIKDLKGVEWWSRGIDLELAREIAAWADARGHALVTLVGDYIYHAHPASWAGEDWEPQPFERVVDSNLDPLTAPPLRIISVGEEASRALLDRFAPQAEKKVRFDRYERDGRLISLVAVNAAASKEEALSFLCKHWGLSPSQVMALGDNFPDLGMLRWAGVGIAMGNAPPGMREQVEWVGPPNDEAGVAWAVQRFVLDKETS